MYMLYEIIIKAIELYSFVLIIYILMSWFPGARESSFGSIISRLSEPFLEPFRKIIPPLGMIDISPIVAIFVLRYLIPSGITVLFGWFI